MYRSIENIAISGIVISRFDCNSKPLRSRGSYDLYRPTLGNTRRHRGQAESHGDSVRLRKPGDTNLYFSCCSHNQEAHEEAIKARDKAVRF